MEHRATLINAHWISLKLTQSALAETDPGRFAVVRRRARLLSGERNKPTRLRPSAALWHYSADTLNTLSCTLPTLSRSLTTCRSWRVSAGPARHRRALALLSLHRLRSGRLHTPDTPPREGFPPCLKSRPYGPAVTNGVIQPTWPPITPPGLVTVSHCWALMSSCSTLRSLSPATTPPLPVSALGARQAAPPVIRSTHTSTSEAPPFHPPEGMFVVSESAFPRESVAGI